MRIISLAPSNTEILFAIGAGEDIIARTAYCDYPKEALRIPKIGDWTNPSIEKIESLESDLVLTSTVVQEKLAKSLREKGMTALHLDPRTLDGVFDSIATIGKAVGRTAESEGLVKKMKSDLYSFSPGKRPRLYIEEWHKPPYASGNWVSELAKIAGADYFPIEKGELSREVTTGEIIGFDPQIIVLSICGVKAAPDIILRREGWSGLSAVKSGQIHSFDDSLLNRPGPRLVEGTNNLKSIISSWQTSG